MTTKSYTGGRNSAVIRPNGPIHLRGRILSTGDANAEAVEFTRVALCRCGASNNKPLCDGSHAKSGFADSGRFAKTPVSAAAEPTGVVRLNPITNGPLMIEGRIELRAADDSSFVTEDKTWLCRCGQSANKPFCDGTHKRIGFVA